MKSDESYAAFEQFPSQMPHDSHSFICHKKAASSYGTRDSEEEAAFLFSIVFLKYTKWVPVQ